MKAIPMSVAGSKTQENPNIFGRIPNILWFSPSTLVGSILVKTMWGFVAARRKAS